VTGAAAISRRRVLGGSAGAAGLAATGTGVVVWSATDRAAADPEPSVADVGFLTDMSVHHGQALVLCQRVLGRDVGTPVTAAAAEVLQNQAIELGMMRAWLTDWSVSTAPPENVMEWMDWCDGVPLSKMPGLASDAELEELADLDGMAQGRRWLELMSAHHEGGVAMAEEASYKAVIGKVARLAQNQAAVQSFEIEQYRLLLATTYAA